MGCTPHQLKIADQTIDLLPHRAAYWRDRSTLLVADIHLGKSETLAAAGVPIPRGIVEVDLERFGHAVDFTGATRVIVLGDLLHAPIGIVPALIDQVAQWRRSISAEIWLVPGNHDRAVHRIADAWGLHLCPPSVEEGPFLFVHDPADPAACNAEPHQFVWCGHVHPRVRLVGGGDALSLECFVVSDRAGILPAFSRFTAGGSVRLSPSDRVFAIAPDHVFPAPSAPPPGRRPRPAPSPRRRAKDHT